MAAAAASSVFRYSRWDAVLVAAAIGHGVVLLLWASIPVIGLGMWWCANTVSHNFIHLPFFRSRGMNGAFSIYLSLLLGLPQSLWRQRHLAHHAERRWRWRMTRLMAGELACVAALWVALSVAAPAFFVSAYLPGWLLGLALCQLQGHYEHAHGTTSHYGRVYNLLFFNDGFHAEHHRKPARHWRALRAEAPGDARSSQWPAVLRWLDWFSLASLERQVLRSGLLQRFVLGAHERAFRKLLRRVPPPERIAVVGGGLFPRTALILKRLAPEARIVIIDANNDHISIAKTFLNGAVQYQHRRFDSDTVASDYDLVIIPLSFEGDRESLYAAPPARALFVHEWIWRRGGRAGAIVSALLLKRVNLVTQ